MSKNRKNNNGNILGIILDIIPPLATGPLVLFVVILVAGNFKPSLTMLLLAFLYLAVSIVYGFVILCRRKSRKDRSEKQNIVYKAMGDTLIDISQPVFMISGDGVIAWANKEANKVFSSGDLYGKNFDELSSQTIASIIANLKETPEMELNGRKYEMTHTEFTYRGETYYVLLLNDVTRIKLWRRRYENSRMCVAVILIDNLAELTSQGGKGDYRDAANIIDRLLKEWAESLGAMIKEIASDRYIMIFRQEHIKPLESTGFEILEKIDSAQRDVVPIPLTVSMGVSAFGDAIVEREKEAVIALDNALQRGGAQVALRVDKDGYSFYGGRRKTSQKRTSVRSRLEAARLITLIEASENVIVMGHANPDYDAIGACIGLARLAATYGKPVHVVTNKHCENFRICTERLLTSDDDGYYSDLFIDGEKGLDAVRADTLVILADVNSVDRCESPQIVNNCSRLAIIDHHRRAGNVSMDSPDLNYLDPSASSTCEIVSEMLDFSPTRVGLSAEEANVMMSGIMLDTQNFIKSVGTRTFSAALYLRNAGASNEVANTFFYESMEDYTVQTKLTEKIKIYRGKYVIAAGTLGDDVNPRVAISKLANKLLSFKGVGATFVAALHGNMIYVSARSNGKINVQLILEGLGGGGHFEAAAAQLENETLKSAMTKLQAAIDEYEEKRT